EKADVMHADHYWNGAGERGGVLHVQQVGAVPAKVARQLETQADERIGGYPPRGEARRHPGRALVHRQIRDELRFGVQRGESVEEVADVHLVTGELPPDGVRVDGKLHAVFSIDTPRPLRLAKFPLDSRFNEWRAQFAVEHAPGRFP